MRVSSGKQQSQIKADAPKRIGFCKPASPADSSHTQGAATVVGWQETILNRNGVCDQCNTILAKGEQAAVGLPIQQRPILLCKACLNDLSPTGPSAKANTE